MSDEEPEEKEDHVPPFLRGQPYVPEALGEDDIDEQPGIDMNDVEPETAHQHDTNMNENIDTHVGELAEIAITTVDGSPALQAVYIFDDHFGEEEGDQNCIQPLEGTPPNAIGPPRVWRNRTQIFAEVIQPIGDEDPEACELFSHRLHTLPSIGMAELTNNVRPYNAQLRDRNTDYVHVFDAEHTRPTMPTIREFALLSHFTGPSRDEHWRLPWYSHSVWDEPISNMTSFAPRTDLRLFTIDPVVPDQHREMVFLACLYDGPNPHLDKFERDRHGYIRNAEPNFNGQFAILHHHAFPTDQRGNEDFFDDDDQLDPEIHANMILACRDLQDALNDTIDDVFGLRSRTDVEIQRILTLNRANIDQQPTVFCSLCFHRLPAGFFDPSQITKGRRRRLCRGCAYNVQLKWTYLNQYCAANYYFPNRRQCTQCEEFLNKTFFSNTQYPLENRICKPCAQG